MRGAKPRRDLIGLVAVGREEGLHQLRMSRLAVVALPVVLHDQLPVRGLDQVDLRSHLGAAQLVGLHVRRHRGGHLVEVVRGVVGQADEEQSIDDAEVDGSQAEAALVEPRRLVARVQQRPVGGVGPLVVAAHDVADRSRAIGEETRAPVAAHVVQRTNVLVVVAQHDHRVGADVDREEVTGLSHLGLGPDEEPRARPYCCDVHVEERRTGVAGSGEGVAGNPGVQQRGGLRRPLLPAAVLMSSSRCPSARGLQMAEHRRRASYVAAWMLRLATASPIRYSSNSPSVFVRTVCGRTANSCP